MTNAFECFRMDRIIGYYGVNGLEWVWNSVDMLVVFMAALDLSAISKRVVCYDGITDKKWGNSSVIRFSKESLRQVGFENNSLIEVEIVGNKLILQKVTKHQSIQDLFKDYQGGSFKSELVGLEPVGNELW